MDKRALARSVVAQLEGELARQTEAAHGSRREATDAENKAENKYDMRSQSAAYLAAGRPGSPPRSPRPSTPGGRFPGAGPPGRSHRRRFPRHPGRRGPSAAYLVGPHSGGLEARDGAASATVVTPSSPLGRQLVGRRAGDFVQVAGRKGTVPFRIASVE